MHPQLSYGVMVAQQVLVLFVVVRIRLGQRLNKSVDIQTVYQPIFFYKKIDMDIQVWESLWVSPKNQLQAYSLKHTIS